MPRPKTNQKRKTKRQARPKNWPLFAASWIKAAFFNWYRRNIFRKLLTWLIIAASIVILIMYTVAQWYIYSNRHKPYELGVTFIPAYANFYGMDPQETMLALIKDLGFENFRLVSYWNEIEYEEGTYDFSSLDWQFDLAEEHNLNITLSIGLRQPRWPECHKPAWAEGTDMDTFWYPKLKDFMQATIERYQDRDVLKYYQLENEFLLEVFGECPDHSRERLVDSFDFVKSLDDTRPVIITRSNNATPSWPVGEPRGDLNGAAVYKRVWDKTVTKRYFEYPLPAWYYAFLAGGAKLHTGQETILHELQAEPWLPDGYDMRTASTEELYQTMDAERLRDRFEYGRQTGMRVIDLWGAEWWYYRKTMQNDPSLWDAARKEIIKTEKLNQVIMRR